MKKAAAIITNRGGRTCHAAIVSRELGVPAIVLAQNERELTHFFATPEFGFEALGLGAHVDDTVVLERFVRISQSFELRAAMSRKMAEADLAQGRRRVNALIRALLDAEGHDDTTEAIVPG